MARKKTTTSDNSTSLTVDINSIKTAMDLAEVAGNTELANILKKHNLGGFGVTFKQATAEGRSPGRLSTPAEAAAGLSKHLNNLLPSNFNGTINPAANRFLISSAVHNTSGSNKGQVYANVQTRGEGRGTVKLAIHSVSGQGDTIVPEPPSVKRGFKLPPNPGPFQSTLGKNVPSVQTVFSPKPPITMPTFKKQVASGLFEGATPGVTVPSAKDFRTMETSGFHSLAGTSNIPDASRMYSEELNRLRLERYNISSFNKNASSFYRDGAFTHNVYIGKTSKSITVPGIDPRIANTERYNRIMANNRSSRSGGEGGSDFVDRNGRWRDYLNSFTKAHTITPETSYSPSIDATFKSPTKGDPRAFYDKFDMARQHKQVYGTSIFSGLSGNISQFASNVGKTFSPSQWSSSTGTGGQGSIFNLLNTIISGNVKPGTPLATMATMVNATGAATSVASGPGGASGLMSAALAHGGGPGIGGAGKGGGGGAVSSPKLGGFGGQVFEQFRHAAIWSGYSPLLAAGAVVGSAMIGQQDYVSQPAFSLIGAGFKRPEREASKMWALNTAGAYQKPQEKLGVLKALTSAFGESPTAANLGKLQHLSNAIQNTALYTMGSPEDIAQFAGRATNTLMSKDKSVKGQSRDEVMKGVLNMVSGMSETETIKLPGIVTASKYALPSLLSAGFSGPEAYGMMQYFQEQGIGDSQVGVGFRKLSSGQPIVDKMAKTSIIREELEKAFQKYGYNRAAVNKVAPLMAGRWSEASLAKKDPQMLARLTKRRAEISAAMKGDVKGLGLSAINYGKNIEYFQELGFDTRRLADQESLPLLYSFAQMDSTKEFREFVDKRKKDYKDPSRNNQVERDRQLETDTPRGAASVLWNKSEAALYRIAQSRGVPLMKGALRMFNDSQAAESLEWAIAKGDKESVTSLVAQTRDLASRGEAEALTPEAIRGAKNLQHSRNLSAEDIKHAKNKSWAASTADQALSAGLAPINALSNMLGGGTITPSAIDQAVSMSDDAELGLMGWGGIYNDRQRLNFEGTRTKSNVFVDPEKTAWYQKLSILSQINFGALKNSVKGFFGYNYDKKNTLFLNEYTGETPWGGAVEQFPNQPNGMMPSQGEINTTQKQIEAGSFNPIIHIYIDGVKQDPKQVNANATVNGQPTSPTQAPASTGGNQ